MFPKKHLWQCLSSINKINTEIQRFKPSTFDSSHVPAWVFDWEWAVGLWEQKFGHGPSHSSPRNATNLDFLGVPFASKCHGYYRYGHHCGLLFVGSDHLSEVAKKDGCRTT